MHSGAPLPVSRLVITDRLALAPRLRSEDLFRTSHEVIIEHQGQEYRLRLTRNRKLILNK